MQQNTELGQISNEMTDMILAGATGEELKPLVEESMKIMDQMKAERKES